MLGDARRISQRGIGRIVAVGDKRERIVAAVSYGTGKQTLKMYREV